MDSRPDAFGKYSIIMDQIHITFTGIQIIQKK